MYYRKCFFRCFLKYHKKESAILFDQKKDLGYYSNKLIEETYRICCKNYYDLKVRLQEYTYSESIKANELNKRCSDIHSCFLKPPYEREIEYLKEKVDEEEDLIQNSHEKLREINEMQTIK